ncbi:MAG TPA: amino acid adenylation domain-containing protein [Polyangiaceae bacterium]|nr:amino acid adenylation domain-containing protein [Polyangiaceae bacterium]
MVALVRRAAERHPERLAVVCSRGRLTYAALELRAERAAAALADRGVSAGDRVGLWAHKSANLVATMLGVLRLGAAYVPIDPTSPTARVAHIVADCCLAALVVAREAVPEGLGDVETLQLDELVRFDGRSGPRPSIDPDALAYVLYTSGSTGAPKGVCLSHTNALAFVEWARRELEVTPEDRLANHAPFHFDLSVFDLYAAFAAGACVHLVPEALAYAPSELVSYVASRALTLWYSTPSVLMLMIARGHPDAWRDLRLRAVLFAGEPFPIDKLAQLRRLVPEARLLNLYGPTETNVCTYHEVTPSDLEGATPPPIGRACSGDEVVVLTSEGRPARAGEIGELLVRGPTVMMGYWGKAPWGGQAYPTGDLVRVLPDGALAFVGRRDDQVKVRGHRIELGEIEHVLMKHPDVEAAAVAVVGEGAGRRLVAWLVSSAEPSLVAIKRHCATWLPRHMVVDGLRYVSSLPLTSTGKIDRRHLVAMSNEERRAS